MDGKRIRVRKCVERKEEKVKEARGKRHSLGRNIPIPGSEGSSGGREREGDEGRERKGEKERGKDRKNKERERERREECLWEVLGCARAPE